jgi:hypothetical protein
MSFWRRTALSGRRPPRCPRGTARKAPATVPGRKWEEMEKGAFDLLSACDRGSRRRPMS